MLQSIWISVKEDSATVPLIVSGLISCHQLSLMLYFYAFALCSFTPFLSAFFAIPSKNIALLNEFNRCVNSSIEFFLKNKGL